METMEKLIRRFNRTGRGYVATLDRWDSYPGYYVVNIQEPTCSTWARYTFRTAQEFEDWMNGVVLD